MKPKETILLEHLFLVSGRTLRATKFNRTGDLVLYLYSPDESRRCELHRHFNYLSSVNFVYLDGGDIAVWIDNMQEVIINNALIAEKSNSAQETPKESLISIQHNKRLAELTEEFRKKYGQDPTAGSCLPCWQNPEWMYEGSGWIPVGPQRFQVRFVAEEYEEDGEPDGWDVYVDEKKVCYAANKNMDISDRSFEPLWKELGITMTFEEQN